MLHYLNGDLLPCLDVQAPVIRNRQPIYLDFYGGINHGNHRRRVKQE